MEDYRLSWLKGVIKELVKNISEKSTYPSNNIDNALFSIELIIDPVISIFEDYKGALSMGINLGYNYYYSETISEKIFNLHTKLDGEILSNLLTLISAEYKGIFFAFGFCNDSSYVAFHKKKMMKGWFGNSFVQFTFGDESEVLDKYLWMDSLLSKQINSSIIYSMFPKEKITLSDAKKLKIEEEKLTKLKHKEDIQDKNTRGTLTKEMLANAKKMIKEGKPIKNLLVSGDGGVGKTSFIFRFFLNKFYPDTAMTNCVEFFLKKITVDNREFALFIWDVMGQDRARFLVEFIANNIDGAIFCFDLTRPITLDKMEEWINIIRKSNPDIPITFLGMKIDLVDSILVDDEYALLFKDKYDLFDYIKISSKTGENVNEAFNRIIDKIKQPPALEEMNILDIEKKFKLLEYLKFYKIQGKEELKIYVREHYNDDLLEEDWKANQLLLFLEFKEKIQKFIDNL